VAPREALTVLEVTGVWKKEGGLLAYIVLYCMLIKKNWIVKYLK
jgi:hypothetical protein